MQVKCCCLLFCFVQLIFVQPNNQGLLGLALLDWSQDRDLLTLSIWRSFPCHVDSYLSPYHPYQNLWRKWIAAAVTPNDSSFWIPIVVSEMRMLEIFRGLLLFLLVQQAPMSIGWRSFWINNCHSLVEGSEINISVEPWIRLLWSWGCYVIDIPSSSIIATNSIANNEPLPRVSFDGEVDLGGLKDDVNQALEGGTGIVEDDFIECIWRATGSSLGGKKVESGEMGNTNTEFLFSLVTFFNVFSSCSYKRR